MIGHKKAAMARTITAFVSFPKNAQREKTQAVLRIIMVTFRSFIKPPSFELFYIVTAICPNVNRGINKK